MVNRLVLALLALFAGLAAQIAPAHARIGQGETTTIACSGLFSATNLRHTSAQENRPTATPPPSAFAERALVVPVAFGLPALTVLAGVDRARE